MSPVVSSAADPKPVDLQFSCNINTAYSGNRDFFRSACAITVQNDDGSVKTYAATGLNGGVGNTNAITEIKTFMDSRPWAGVTVTNLGDKQAINSTGYASKVACVSLTCAVASLTTKPADNTQTIAQMPTTGAPEGLSSAGLMAVVVSVLGLMVLLLKRRTE